MSFVRDRDLRFKTILFAAVASVSNVLGNFALSEGMRHLGGTVSVSVVTFLRVLLNGWIGMGVCLLAVWMVSQLSLLSWADLTYVVPVTSSSYVLTAVLGAVALNEYISPVHWAGILLICLGILVVGRTAPRTAANPEAPE